MPIYSNRHHCESQAACFPSSAHRALCLPLENKCQGQTRSSLGATTVKGIVSHNYLGRWTITQAFFPTSAILIQSLIPRRCCASPSPDSLSKYVPLFNLNVKYTPDFNDMVWETQVQHQITLSVTMSVPPPPQTDKLSSDKKLS